MGTGGNARRESSYTGHTSEGRLGFEEDKRTPVFPLFVVLIIHHTSAFLFSLSFVRQSVFHFFVLYGICFLVILPVRIDKGHWFSNGQ